jgi:hypothetical protein
MDRELYFKGSQSIMDMKETIEDPAYNGKRMAERVGDQVRGAAQTVREKVKEATIGFAGAVTEKAHDVAAGASKMAGSAMDTAQEWASSVAGAAVQAKDKTQEAAVAAGEMAGDFGRNVTAQIRRHPLSALLISFGAGWLLAHVLRRPPSKGT